MFLSGICLYVQPAVDLHRQHTCLLIHSVEYWKGHVAVTLARVWKMMGVACRVVSQLGAHLPLAPLIVPQASVSSSLDTYH